MPSTGRSDDWWVQHYGLCCNYCEAESDLCLDHIRPSSKGGVNHSSNFQVLCRGCNTAKGSRDDTGVEIGAHSRYPLELLPPYEREDVVSVEEAMQFVDWCSRARRRKDKWSLALFMEAALTPEEV